MTAEAPEFVSEHGDEWAPECEVLRTLVGSSVHGLAVGDTDDRDEMGVYVPPPEYLIGVRQAKGSYVARTQPDGARSGAGDVDLTLYSLQHWARQVVKGNPTMILPIFAPDAEVISATPVGRLVREQAPSLLSQVAGHRFLGYLHAQKERLLGGGKQNRMPNRPELVERYGFDTKYAAHAVRLAVQGVELLTTGRLTLPMDDPWRSTILGIRTGAYSLAEALRMVDTEAERLVDLMASGASPLPVRPHLARVSVTVTQWTLAAWAEQ
jgi:hypothetical protein